MKKRFLMAVGLLLAAVFAVSVAAAPGILQLDDASGQLGQTVFLKVALNESVAGDTMGITYHFDDALLEPIPESCRWEKAGILQDFSESNNAGVWATNEAVELHGTLCVLAFKIHDKAKVGDTKVNCTLLVKHGSKEVGSFTAEATVTVTCSHQYGSWESNGSLLHRRACSLCGDTQSQSHTWDSGTEKNDGDKNVTVVTYRCAVCDGTKTEERPKQSGETENSGDGSSWAPSTPIPTVTNPYHPQETEPTHTSRPTTPIPTVTNPYHPQESTPTQGASGSNGGSTQPGGNPGSSTQPGTGNVPGTEPGQPGATVPNDHDHEENGQPENATQDPHAGHDHSNEDTHTETGGNNSLLVAACIFAVFGVFLAVSALLAKKKR